MCIMALFVISKKEKQPKSHSTDEWTNKNVDPFNGLLFLPKKKWSSDTCQHVDEPWKHYTQWKKLDTKAIILHDSIYMKYLE